MAYRCDGCGRGFDGDPIVTVIGRAAIAIAGWAQIVHEEIHESPEDEINPRR